MLAIAFFWLVLCLPGYALLRRLRPDVLDGGFASNVALSYLATFVLLSPVSIAGYLFHLPISALSVSIVVAVLGAAVWLLRSASARTQWPKASPIAIIASGLIVCDALLGLRAGSYLKDDATYHVTLIYRLLANGFNSWDPLVPGGRFDAIYHTNLYHALMAAACELTSRSAPEVWAYTWFWAKLASAASTYHLARVVLGARWLAWTAAVMFTAWMAPVSLLTFPHDVTVYFLVALGLAFAIEAVQGGYGLRSAAGLAATALVLPQFHGLCYLFLMVAAAPVMLGRLAYVQLRRLPGRRALLLAILALGLGAPWFAPHVWERAHRPSSPQVPLASHEPSGDESSADGVPSDIQPRDVTLMYRGFIRLAGGMLMFDPAPLEDWRNETTQLLLALLAGMFGRRRSTFLVVCAMTGVILALLYFPPLCTLAVRATGRGWIVGRFTAVLTCLHFATFPGAFFLAAERLGALAGRAPLLLRRLSAAAFRPLSLAATLGVAYVNGVDSPPLTRRGYWDNARNVPQLKKLDHLVQQEALFRRNVPAGAILAVEPSIWSDIAMVCNCYPLALPANRGDYGVPDMAQRREDLAKLVYLETSLADRIPVLRHYGVRHIFLYHTGRSFYQRLEALYAPITVKVAKESGMGVLTVDPDR